MSIMERIQANRAVLFAVFAWGSAANAQHSDLQGALDEAAEAVQPTITCTATVDPGGVYTLDAATMQITQPVLNVTCVDDQGNPVATLNWTPPAENTDGSPLVDLAGYRVYYDVSSGVCAEDNVPAAIIGTVDSYQMEIQPGVGYFALTAFNTAGVNSDCSVEISHSF